MHEHNLIIVFISQGISTMSSIKKSERLRTFQSWCIFNFKPSKVEGYQQKIAAHHHTKTKID